MISWLETVIDGQNDVWLRGYNRKYDFTYLFGGAFTFTTEGWSQTGDAYGNITEHRRYITGSVNQSTRTTTNYTFAPTTGKVETTTITKIRRGIETTTNTTDNYYILSVDTSSSWGEIDPLGVEHTFSSSFGTTKTSLTYTNSESTTSSTEIRKLIQLDKSFTHLKTTWQTTLVDATTVTTIAGPKAPFRAVCNTLYLAEPNEVLVVNSIQTPHGYYPATPSQEISKFTEFAPSTTLSTVVKGSLFWDNQICILDFTSPAVSWSAPARTLTSYLMVDVVEYPKSFTRVWQAGFENQRFPPETGAGVRYGLEQQTSMWSWTVLSAGGASAFRATKSFTTTYTNVSAVAILPHDGGQPYAVVVTKAIASTISQTTNRDGDAVGDYYWKYFTNRWNYSRDFRIGAAALFLGQHRGGGATALAPSLDIDVGNLFRTPKPGYSSQVGGLQITQLGGESHWFPVYGFNSSEARRNRSGTFYQNGESQRRLKMPIAFPLPISIEFLTSSSLWVYEEPIYDEEDNLVGYDEYSETYTYLSTTNFSFIRPSTLCFSWGTSNSSLKGVNFDEVSTTILTPTTTNTTYGYGSNQTATTLETQIQASGAYTIKTEGTFGTKRVVGFHNGGLASTDLLYNKKNTILLQSCILQSTIYDGVNSTDGEKTISDFSQIEVHINESITITKLALLGNYLREQPITADRHVQGESWGVQDY